MGAYTYNVLLSSTLQIDEGHPAIVNMRTCELLIDLNQTDAQKTHCLLHELDHIIEDNYSINLSEQDNNRIASGYLEFLQNNLGIEFDWSGIPIKGEADKVDNDIEPFPED